MAAGRQSKRGNNGNAFGRLYQRDLRVHEIDHDTALPPDTCFRQMLIDELLVRIASSQDQREAKKWCAPDSGSALESPQAQIEFAGFDPLQDRSEMRIEQSNTQIGSLTPELPDGLRQDTGRDEGRRSHRQHLSGSFRSPSNP